MKMAKASEADLEMALDLSRMLEDFEGGYFPLPKDSDDDEAEHFDSDKGEHCRRAMEMILDTIRRGSIFRVTFGMLVMCDPRNEMLDPALSYLEHHPDAKWAREQRAELVDALDDALPMVVDCAFTGRCLLEDVETDETVLRIRAILSREAAYGLIRYLAGGGWLPFVREGR